MNIYGKLAKARAQFHALELKKTGHNKFAGYKYFELADFLVPGLKCMADNGLVPVISFDAEEAVMTIHDAESDDAIYITSPMRDANLKGCHPIQNLGAVETYQTRYLWVSALQIVEHDAIDGAAPVDEPVDNSPITQTQAVMIRDELEAAGGDEAAFCKWLKVQKLEDIPARSFDTAMAAINRKRAASNG